MNGRKVLIGFIIVVCAFAIVYAVYYQLSSTNSHVGTGNVVPDQPVSLGYTAFDKLFDNKLNVQGYKVNDELKRDQTKDLVYTNYTLHEIYEGKYDINVNIPIINVNNANVTDINKEINAIFMDKVNSIIADKNNINSSSTIYTVDYTAYLNENILSLVISATLKENGNAQRVIIKSYTYNLSTNVQIPLANMLIIKGRDSSSVESSIKKTIQESISREDNLEALGYKVYERDINSSIYTVESSNEYLLGPDGIIYIIYAYGNSSFTSEKDIVVIK